MELPATYTFLLLSLITQSYTSPNLNPTTFYLKLLVTQSPPPLNTTTCLILSQETLQKSTDFSTSPVQISVSQLPPGEEENLSISSCSLPPSSLVEIFAPSLSIAQFHLNYSQPPICSNLTHEPISLSSLKSAPPEILPFFSTGPSSNRIDVVFMGDGYTSSSRPKFISDMNRLIEGSFLSPTSPFFAFLPLLNIWGIFVPSVESGIGYNGSPKNTPFRLYRPRGPLRSVYTRNPSAARRTCLLVGRSGCDFPVLIANDPFYGGLGGEFAIATSSPTSGVSILRHELGHNFARVGEEYDGGGVYSGANSSPSLRRIKWAKWLSSGSASSPKEERMIYRISSYPSPSDLNRRPLSYAFRSDGSYAKWSLQITFSGVTDFSNIQVSLDDVPLEWPQSAGNKSSGDKVLYDWSGSLGLSRGQHSVKIKSLWPIITADSSSIPQEVGSVGLYEYGKDFHTDPEYIGAFPTWDTNGRKTYRPTNAGCLMRNMTFHKLCSVCNEAVWLNFLRRVSLIDSLKVEGKSVSLTTLRVGQFREKLIPGETLDITWFKNGTEIKKLKGFTQFESKDVGSRVAWEVKVELRTSEVRNDPRRYLVDRKRFVISS